MAELLTLQALALCGLYLFGIFVCVVACLEWRRMRTVLAKPPAWPPLPALPPLVVELAAPKGRARQDLRLMDEDGVNEIARVTVEGRPSTIRHRTTDGALSVCAASHVGADGIWIYRRVGIERE